MAKVFPHRKDSSYCLPKSIFLLSLNLLTVFHLPVSFQITIIHSRRALGVRFIDTGRVAYVKVTDLREIPSQFLREVIKIPPQV